LRDAARFAGGERPVRLLDNLSLPEVPDLQVPPAPGP
jgi:hypothetical protein